MVYNIIWWQHDLGIVSFGVIKHCFWHISVCCSWSRVVSLLECCMCFV